MTKQEKIKIYNDYLKHLKVVGNKLIMTEDFDSPVEVAIEATNLITAGMNLIDAVKNKKNNRKKVN